MRDSAAVDTGLPDSSLLLSSHCQPLRSASGQLQRVRWNSQTTPTRYDQLLPQIPGRVDHVLQFPVPDHLPLPDSHCHGLHRGISDANHGAPRKTARIANRSSRFLGVALLSED